jgi:HAD superfamily hydrolase (TIGR01484 family)
VPPSLPDSPLVVCDLDGTLLRSGGILSDYSRTTLQALTAAGVALTVATARSLPAITALLAGVEFPLPVIELGGSYLSDAATGRHVSRHSLDRATAAKLVAAVLAAGLEPALTTWDGRADRLHHGDLADEGAAWYVDEKRKYGDPRLRHSPDFGRVAREEDVALVRFAVRRDREPDALKLLADLGSAGTTVQSYPIGYLPGWVEFAVHSARADKGQAVLALRDRHALTGPVVACGDHLNDLPMFAVADRRVAPANAHPDILALATDVVGPNDEDGVARFLAREFLGG